MLTRALPLPSVGQLAPVHLVNARAIAFAASFALAVADVLIVAREREDRQLRRVRGTMLRERRRTQSREELIANLSHDLRNPLAIALGFAEMAEDDSLTAEDRASALSGIRRSLWEMSQMVENVLDGSTDQAGALVPLPEPLDLEGLCDEALAATRILLRRRPIVLTGSLEPGLLVFADRNRLARVIGNLLREAAAMREPQLTRVRRTVGDVRVIVKLRIRDNERGGLGAAFVPQASFPTGDAAAFRGDDAYNIEGRFALDYRFRFGLTLLANAGFNYRTSDQVALLTRVSSTVRYGIGFLQRLPKDFSVFGEANAATSIYQEAGGPLYFPVEGYVGARYVNQPTRVTVSLGGGGSLYSSLSPPGSPLFRVFFSVGFLPNASWTLPKPDNTPKRGGRKDRDADGVFGDDDRCPEEAGPAENNGCPDTDEDNDGIVDRLDKCQDQAGPPENNGCPDVDTDKDGVVDRLDKCVDKPGPKANDGCPEADEDGDGIIDRLDKCPKEAGPKAKIGRAHV
mgnify:CR=1 FL=1